MIRNLATAAAIALACLAAPADAHAATGQLEQVCVVNRTNGVVTHRYVLVYRMTDEGKQTGTHRMPRRDYPGLWSKLCGPNGEISKPS